MTVACAPQLAFLQFTSMTHERRSIQPVILAGVARARRWPRSRKEYSKWLVQLIGREWLSATNAWRPYGLEASCPVSRAARLVCVENHSHISGQRLIVCGKPARILLERLAYSSAPALPVAALKAVGGDNGAEFEAMLANHVAPHVDAPKAPCRAPHFMQQTAPSSPSASCYVMRSGATDTFASVSPSEAVAASLSIRFVGKPHRAMAVHYVRPAEYPDNRGVFVVRASIWLSVTHELHRAIDAGRQAAYDNRSPNGKLEHLALKDFDAYPDEVIVYGVVERLPECHGIFGFVVPMDSSCPTSAHGTSPGRRCRRILSGTALHTPKATSSRASD
jgi:mannose-1-phosphate guanylyltransferase/mannose-6-phosphate isomerase